MRKTAYKKIALEPIILEPPPPHEFYFHLHVTFGGVLLAGLGSMMHFAYVWTGCQDWAAVPFAVNESVYEHAKIMLFPVLLWWCVLFPLVWCGDAWLEYWRAGTVAMYSAMAVLLLGNSLVVGLGFETLWVDIVLFVVSIFCGQYAGLQGARSPPSIAFDVCCGLLLIFAVVVLCVCTYFPMHTPLFEDLRDHTYGRPVHCG
jgi:hypothetical protein